MLAVDFSAPGLAPSLGVLSVKLSLCETRVRAFRRVELGWQRLCLDLAGCELVRGRALDERRDRRVLRFLLVDFSRVADIDAAIGAVFMSLGVGARGVVST